MVGEYEGLCERHELPPVPGGLEILDARYSARTRDWHILTKDGWFYCRGDGAPERREWVPSVYGPTA